MTAAAADTLREPTLPSIGTLNRTSQVLATSGLRPPPSLPRTRHRGPLRSASHGATPPVAVAPWIQTPDCFSFSSAVARFVSRATLTDSAAPIAVLAAAPVSPT